MPSGIERISARAAASDWSRMISTARSNVATPYLSTSVRDEIAPEQAAGKLRGDVAHQLHRLARVVLDDAIDLLDRLALRLQA